MKTTWIKACVAASLLFAAGPAMAEDHTITQADKKFSERRITISAGESITFVNDDGTTHNVHSTTAGHEFDLGAQAPGESSTHIFNSAGTAKVRCAIHPKMKIDVIVE